MSRLISFEPGSVLLHDSRECAVLDTVSADSVLVAYVDDGEVQTVHVSELAVDDIETTSAQSNRTKRLLAEALPLVSDQRWAVARKRWLVLKDLLKERPHYREAAKVKAAARELDRSPAAVYRLMADFDATQSLRVLMRLPRADKGTKKILPKVARLMRAVFKVHYLSDQRKRMSTIAEMVEERCKKKGWPVPHKSTVISRLKALPQKVVVQAREGRKAARGRHDLTRGKHPDIAYPLGLCQMDHSPSDYCIVDEVHRRPIDGAQTLSVVLDINTRCIMGFTLMMEAPSVRVAGACMAHAILPKERFLKEMGVEAYWPCYGKPSVIYTDNASEFEATYFLRACQVHGIEARKRPKGTPNYAGSIESLFRTFLQSVHELEGSRFSNWVHRMEYDSTGRAIMTIQEFRRWFTIYITKYYHQKPHSGLADLPPIKAWDNGILGVGDKPGIGIPDRETDEFRLRIDFLPGMERTIQDYGIAIARRQYSDTVLRRWVGARDPSDLKQVRKFIVKYDPYDMSEVYFLDPDLNQYFPIPVVGELEHITYWENSILNRRVRRENRTHVNHAVIHEGLDEMRDVRKTAAKTTKKARRDQQRELDSKRQSVPKQRRAAVAPPVESDSSLSTHDDDDIIQPLPGAVAPTAVKAQS